MAAREEGPRCRSCQAYDNPSAVAGSVLLFLFLAGFLSFGALSWGLLALLSSCWKRGVDDRGAWSTQRFGSAVPVSCDKDQVRKLSCHQNGQKCLARYGFGALIKALIRLRLRSCGAYGGPSTWGCGVLVGSFFGWSARCGGRFLFSCLFG